MWLTILGCLAVCIVPYCVCIAPLMLCNHTTHAFQRWWMPNKLMLQRQRTYTVIACCDKLPREIVKNHILTRVVTHVEQLMRRRVWWHELGWVVTLASVQVCWREAPTCTSCTCTFIPIYAGVCLDHAWDCGQRCLQHNCLSRGNACVS